MSGNYSIDDLNREAEKICEEIVRNVVTSTDLCRQCGGEIDGNAAECKSSNHDIRKFHLECVPKEARDFLVQSEKFDAFKCKECKVMLNFYYSELVIIY